MIKPSYSQTISKPSIPEFAVKYVDNSYDVAPTYGIDQYTGKNVMTEAGYYVQNKSIDVWVSDQAFSTYKNTDGNIIMMYYDIQWKGHFADNWINSNTSFNGLHIVASNSLLANNELVYPTAPFTIITVGFSGNNGSTPYSMQTDDVSDGGKIDFNVQAFIGYYTMLDSTPDSLFQRIHTIYTFHGESSEWSNTQTISIPDGSVSTAIPTPFDTENPTGNTITSQLASLVLVVTVISVVTVFSLLLYVRHLKRAIPKN